MNFYTQAEYRQFFKDVGAFVQLLLDSGIQLFKYYLDISKDEQARCLEARRRDPLKQWKSSPIDEVALSHSDDYSIDRDEMLQQTHRPQAPWTIVCTDNEKQARLNVIRHLVSSVECPDKDQHISPPDHSVVFSSSDIVADRLAQ